MADTGFKPLGAASTVVVSGGFSWNGSFTVSNLNARDGTFAQNSHTSAIGEYTNRGVATGFDFSAIPAGATIDGIEVTGLFSTTNNGRAYRVLEAYITLDGTNVSGSNLAPTTQFANNNQQVITMGGASDLWGLTPTAAQVKASTFGVILQLENRNSAGSVAGRVDDVQMKVYYTASGGGPVTGTGAIVAPISTLSGTGNVVGPVTGVGAITAPVPTLDGTGDVAVSSTAGIIAPISLLDGTGVVEAGGTAGIVAPISLLAGAGDAGFPMLGNITAPVPAIVGVGDIIIPSQGGVVAPVSVLVGAGLISIPGLGGVLAPVPDIDGTGNVTSLGDASGSILAPVPQITAIAELELPASGNLIAPLPIIDGDGASTALATGGIISPLPIVAGIGGTDNTGVANITAPLSVIAGIGFVTIAGQGGVVATVPSIFGSVGHGDDLDWRVTVNSLTYIPFVTVTEGVDDVSVALPITVPAAATVTVTYTGNDITDAAGNLLVAFADEGVTV